MKSSDLQQAKPERANTYQVGGTHYQKQRIQHWDFVAANNLDYFQGQITKYVSRWRDKNGIDDLLKAQHFLEKYIEIQRENEKLKTAPANQLTLLGRVMPKEELTLANPFAKPGGSITGSLSPATLEGFRIDASSYGFRLEDIKLGPDGNEVFGYYRCDKCRSVFISTQAKYARHRPCHISQVDDSHQPAPESQWAAPDPESHWTARTSAATSGYVDQDNPPKE